MPLLQVRGTVLLWHGLRMVPRCQHGGPAWHALVTCPHDASSLTTNVPVGCREGNNAFPLPSPLPQDYILEVSTNGTKSSPGVGRANPLSFTLDSSTPLQYQYLHRVAQHVEQCEAAQQEHPYCQVSTWSRPRLILSIVGKVLFAGLRCTKECLPLCCSWQ